MAFMKEMVSICITFGGHTRPQGQGRRLVKSITTWHGLTEPPIGSAYLLEQEEGAGCWSTRVRKRELMYRYALEYLCR
jgi:hypothetical protein